MSKKLMIVGGTGFLGYYTAKLALSKGYEVGSISILDDDLLNKDLDSWFPKEIKNTILDVFSASEEEIAEALKGYDYMIYSVGPDDRAFKGVTLLYDLTWKDVMYILGQTLTPESKTRVLGKAVAYGDEWLGNESVGKRENEIAALPTGNQAVPTIEPDWDYNTAKGRWDQSHFVRCILEGFRQVCSKAFKLWQIGRHRTGGEGSSW